MNREEFKQHLYEYANGATPRPFTDEEYRRIEFVYTYSPIISECGGKRKIAILWQEFGLPIIKLMEPQATKHEQLLAEIKDLQSKLMDKREELKDLI